ncbi:hypothetical protein Sphch_0262 [Sphingobium chlorophenolicum L-1]|uniref:Type IV pilus assembly PilZ n=1 Tax=Sphingobium chlorophenolicum L-1 TaxID=690566 RepID=F6EV38_SPHCR|nr:hypothetical protein [Sphingobium chlorophenolicum]AEG47962.1 hypothetical protein Sphch_0262 [Sphingobium chlorophenolicum L-1]
MPDSDPEFVSKRQYERRRRLLKARMRHPRHGEIDILVRNVSELGIGGRCELDLALGDRVVITLPDCAPAEGSIAWRRGQAFGVRLGASIDPANVKSPAPVERPVERAYQVPANFRPAVETKRPGFRTRSPGLDTRFKLD